MADFLGRKGCICKEYAAVVLRKMLLGGFQGHMSLDEAKKEFSGTGRASEDARLFVWVGL